MGPVLYSLHAALRAGLILGLALCAVAQIPGALDPLGFSGRKASDLSLAVLPPRLTPPPPFEFRGIRIGDGLKGAEQRFPALKTPSFSTKPGLCGSDATSRIETCTDVLESGEYVNMTMLDRRVAQIYVATGPGKEGKTYDSFVLALTAKYGKPDKREIKYYRNGVQTGSSGERLRWSSADQYMEGSEIERAITIGSRALDGEIAAKEHRDEHN
jgi:hypothetical protein